MVARQFVGWLDQSSGLFWLDIGCGTGALVEEILRSSYPREVLGVDPSQAFVDYARTRISDPRARFEVASAEHIPFLSGTADVVASGLVLNFVQDPVLALREMCRVCKDDGVVAAYVWDYKGEMQFLDYFWDALLELIPAASEHGEVKGFTTCNPEALRSVFDAGGLEDLEIAAIDVPTNFSNFDDYWAPFLEGKGAAPAFAMSLAEKDRVALRETLRLRLPTAPDGSIDLVARAWAVRGRPRRQVL